MSYAHVGIALEDLDALCVPPVTAPDTQLMNNVCSSDYRFYRERLAHEVGEIGLRSDMA